MKILAIQNRMGIGDTVIFLPFIKAISNRFSSPVSLLVKENSKANEFLNHTKYINSYNLRLFVCVFVLTWRYLKLYLS